MHPSSMFCRAFGFTSIKRRNISPITLTFTDKALYHLHEYQSKKLLQKHGVNIQPFVVVSRSEEKDEIASKIRNLAIRYPKDELVIKAQVMAGGRGKGYFIESGLKGGVKVTNSVDQAIELVTKGMLGKRLVTEQTLQEGVLVLKVMIGRAVEIVHEAYFAIVLDRVSKSPMIICSARGGIDIEQVAKAHPDELLCLPIQNTDLEHGMTAEILKRICHFMKFPAEPHVYSQLKSIYKLFLQKDALQIEINPLAILSNGDVMAIDAKIDCDDSAKFRQRDLTVESLENEQENSEIDPREKEAHSLGLNFVGLSGNIGCLVNGAGLAMATMDIIKEFNGTPANFLDVGGSATETQVKGALKIIISDSNVRSIFVNIFGGIMRCDTIAIGLVSACQNLGANLPPIIVRLAGTRLDEAKEILSMAKLPFLIASDLAEGARLAVTAASCPKKSMGTIASKNETEAVETTAFSCLKASLNATSVAHTTSDQITMKNQVIPI